MSCHVQVVYAFVTEGLVYKRLLMILYEVLQQSDLMNCRFVSPFTSSVLICSHPCFVASSPCWCVHCVSVVAQRGVDTFSILFLPLP